MTDWDKVKAEAVALGIDEPDDGDFLAQEYGMLGMEPQRELEVIESEILFFKRQAGQSIIEIGKRLNEAKAQMSHGEWLPWLQEKVDISERSAQDFMRLAREYSKSAEIADLGATKALALLALPVSERDGFVAEKHTVNGVEKSVSAMTVKELKKAIEERDEARKAAETSRAEAAAAEESRAKMEADMGVLKGLLASAEEKEKQKTEALVVAENELKELRDRPVEVAVQVDEKAVARAVEEARAAADKEWGAKLKKAEEKLSTTEKEKNSLEKQVKQLEKDAEAVATGGEDVAQMIGEVEKLKKQLAMSDAGIAVFKAKFENLQAAFTTARSALGALEPEPRKKMEAAMRTQLEAWSSLFLAE